jgi:FkbM family methyltransferase
MALLNETLSSTNSTIAFATQGMNHGGHGRHGEEGEKEKERGIPSTPNAIPVVSMSTVLKSLPEEAPIDLLKIDIEGSEQQLLTGDTEWLRRVQALIIEFHPAQVDVAALTAILESAGLKSVPLEVVEENVQFFARP